MTPFPLALQQTNEHNSDGMQLQIRKQGGVENNFFQGSKSVFPDSKNNTCLSSGDVGAIAIHQAEAIAFVPSAVLALHLGGLPEKCDFSVRNNMCSRFL